MRDVAPERWTKFPADPGLLSAQGELGKATASLGVPQDRKGRVAQAAVVATTFAAIACGPWLVTPDAKRSESWAVEWFRRECDAQMLASLRAQFDAARRATSSPPFDWRTAAWDGWVPGRDVAWRDFHPDDGEASDVVVDEKTYVLGDTYCVEPGCTCEEIQIIVWLEDADDGRLLLQRIWKAWCDAHPVVALLLARQSQVRKLAPEFQALMARRSAKPASPVSKAKAVGLNKPCPCGSGKKFKKCCM